MKYILTLICALLLVACADKTTAKHISGAVVEFRAASFSPELGYIEMTVKGVDQKVHVSEKVLLSNVDIASAEVIFIDAFPKVGLQMTASGKTKLAQITEQNLNKPIAILVDKQLISAPVVQEKMTGGAIMISGLDSVMEAKRIADDINGQ
jgi:preprotein translocase subunit SecD